ncbi:O-antigen ligase family protein [Salinibacter ruber]|uniref:O-antigen ligase family protein n=1 Tax=Salinibacter ruber TaxID=146919 RepID=UPI00207455CB|nr:O-antigen ligase family protein [Salinibacter ruber]
MDRFLSRYSALCVLALFLGLRYKVGVVLRPFDALIGLGGLFLVGRASVRGRIDRLKKPSVYYLFVAAYSYRCVNALFLSGTGTALKEALQVVEFVLLAHLIAVSTRSSEHRRFFFRTLFIGIGILALVTAVWHVSNGYYVRYKQLGPLKYGFSLFALLAFGTYLRGESRYASVVFLGAVGLTMLSGERKGWVALLGGGGLMYFVYQGRSIRHLLATFLRPRVVFGGTAAIAAIVAIGLQVEYVAEQFETMGEVYVLLSNFDLRMDLSAFETSGSNLARLYLLIFTARTALAHPWFGVGTGQWHEALAAYSGKSQYMKGAHSEYQRFTVENGLTGLVLYILAWGTAIRDSVRQYHLTESGSEARRLEVVGLALFGALINLFLGGGALNILFMALVVGLLVGLENDPGQKKPLPTASPDSE